MTRGTGMRMSRPSTRSGACHMGKSRIFLVALITLAGCGLPHTEKQWPPQPRIGDRELPQSGPELAGASLAQKTVSAKEDPATLVASDRTSCTVPEKKFRETTIGSKVWCNWR